MTTTTAATVYIGGAPIAGTNQTITHGWGLWNAGNTRLDGTLQLGNAYVATTHAVTGYLILYDSTGTAYEVPATAH